jgi:hypothetical protein
MNVAFFTYRIREFRTKVVESTSPCRSRLISCMNNLLNDIDDEQKDAIDERHRFHFEMRKEQIQTNPQSFLDSSSI